MEVIDLRDIKFVHVAPHLYTRVSACSSVFDIPLKDGDSGFEVCVHCIYCQIVYRSKQCS